MSSSATKLCPYGVPGDRLWVRETWRGYDLDGGRFRIEYGGGDVAVIDTDELRARPYLIRDDVRIYKQLSNAARRYPKWGSPRFMPRWASRITLEVKAVRVGRLQGISEADARAEGVEPYQPAEGDGGATEGPAWNRIQFSHGWDALNAKRGYGWASNPWVWVVEFRRLDQAAARAK